MNSTEILKYFLNTCDEDVRKRFVDIIKQTDMESRKYTRYIPYPQYKAGRDFLGDFLLQQQTCLYYLCHYLYWYEADTTVICAWLEFLRKKVRKNIYKPFLGKKLKFSINLEPLNKQKSK